jgi:hypothetical protein
MLFVFLTLFSSLNKTFSRLSFMLENNLHIVSYLYPFIK